jgi:signal transduction histidine kinase
MTLLGDGARPPFDAYDLAVARDVAARLAFRLEQTRAYRSVSDDLRARDDLVAAVSHDLRDPLSAICAGAAVLRRLTPNDAAVARAIELVERNVERMEHLVGNLLDLARHDSAGLPLDLAPRSPRSLVYEALETLGPLAAQKRQQLEARMPADLPDVRCDRHATVRVLANLVGNAIKFTSPGGAIRVRVEPASRQVRFTVSDTGPGIERAELAHVFDRYRQARSSVRSGARLGLSIAKAIVEQTGGAIEVESHVNVGTTFTFTLPIA